MGKVITLTLNPALDISTTVDNVRPDTKLRCRAPRIDPGGGGVNVSRAMAKLGEQSLAFVALGGTIGQSLLARLRDEGVTAINYDIPGETRQSFAVRETSSGDQSATGETSGDVGTSGSDEGATESASESASGAEAAGGTSSEQTGEEQAGGN